MNTVLDKIVARKRDEIVLRRGSMPEHALQQDCRGLPPTRDFRAALEKPGEVRIIAEVKKASPSAGVLRTDFDPVAIAEIYETHGAACISVLTDEPFFQGSLEHLKAVRKHVRLPLLRKDFILDRYQLFEARHAGADAVLLIAEILSDAELGELIDSARQMQLQTLVELYEPANLSRVLKAGARLIGVNNRDLRTFETRLEHTLEIAAQLPDDCLLVSESGIRNREDIRRLQSAGVNAVLIGETLMRSADIGAKLDELRG
jgi:indole-3-glycerol phosphate synthase